MLSVLVVQLMTAVVGFNCPAKRSLTTGTVVSRPKPDAMMALILDSVIGPTWPTCGMPYATWNCVTAACVSGPKYPVTAPEG